jgi:hypothetical protein
VRDISGFDFPENKEETGTWKATRSRHALARCVLAVAHTRIEGAWCAYIDAVPGRRHVDEAQAVLDHGAKLGKDVACVLFPLFADIPYAY